jgi:hypothetical protein
MLPWTAARLKPVPIQPYHVGVKLSRAWRG